MQVLIADDIRTSHDGLTGLVTSRGHEVMVCEIDDAWNAFEGAEPALVILNWSLSGSENLCRRIRNHAAGASAVVVALTERRHIDDLETVLAGGADDCIVRPVDLELFGIRFSIAEHRVREIRKQFEAEAATKRLNDSLTRPNEELNQAVEMLKANRTQLVHPEKMVSLGQLAAGIAREINNPVGFVRSNLGKLRDYVGLFKVLLREYDQLAGHVRQRPMNGEAAILDHINRISQDENLEFMLTDVESLLAESLTGAERVREIAQSLESFARLDEAEMQHADINEGLRTTLRMIWNEPKFHCRIREDLQPLPPILCFPEQLNQVFMNLLENASQAIREEGEITIETRMIDNDVLIRISDTGEGIPQKHIPELFNPLFTTKPIGEGTGLSVSYGIIQKHNGRIVVESELGTGTTFSIFLPITGTGHE